MTINIRIHVFWFSSDVLQIPPIRIQIRVFFLLVQSNARTETVLNLRQATRQSLPVGRRRPSTQMHRRRHLAALCVDAYPVGRGRQV